MPSSPCVYTQILAVVLTGTRYQHAAVASCFPTVCLNITQLDKLCSNVDLTRGLKGFVVNERLSPGCFQGSAGAIAAPVFATEHR